MARSGPEGILRRPGRWIGLMGGSFNPAHEGHLMITRQALARLGLTEVWWLVSPQNPLKQKDGMAPLEKRLATARQTARRDRRIKVLDLETRLGTRYTIDTLKILTSRAADNRFIWIMGADCLKDFHRWRQWKDIFHIVPIAVFDRPGYSYQALAGVAANRFRRHRVNGRQAYRLASRTAPAWTFFGLRRNPASATALRARGDWA